MSKTLTEIKGKGRCFMPIKRHDLWPQAGEGKSHSERGQGLNKSL